MSRGNNKISLDNIPKKDVFNAPEGYFDALPQTIYDKISSENSKNLRKLQSIKNTFWYAAASVAVFALAWFALTSLSSENAGNTTFLAEVSNQDIVAYLEYEDLSVFDLEAELSLDNLSIDGGSAIPDLMLDTDEQMELLEFYDDLG